jgi:hypothetical protein
MVQREYLYIITEVPEDSNISVIRINSTSLIMEALPFFETSATNYQSI